MSKTGITCYRDGGCGPYEMYSCYECPASKSDYVQFKTKPKPMTHADLIRHSADEELADMFWELLTDSQFKNPYREKAELLDWLKAPAEKEVAE